jgi:hypothetical protein
LGSEPRITIMKPLSLWRGVGVKTKDYYLIDKLISEQYRMGGTEFYIHKYLGPVSQTSDDKTMVNTPTADTITPVRELEIQDVLNMEIRDRSYDPNIYSLRGHYSVADTEFDLRQMGLFLNNDTLFITFHQNDMVAQLGRRLMAGDVLEIIHQRDDMVLGQDTAISKYYVVDEGSRPAESYDPLWWPHMWRVKCEPMTDTQEYQSILQQPATDINGDQLIPDIDSSGRVTTLQDLISTYNKELEISERLAEQAHHEVPFRNLQGQQFYVLPGDINKPFKIWNGDGIPPNQSKPVPSGITFPPTPTLGDYFLRVDYSPPQLFFREVGQNKYDVWRRVQIDYRASWSPANRVLETFINNDHITDLGNGIVFPEQQDIKKAVRPRLDPDIV